MIRNARLLASLLLACTLNTASGLRASETGSRSFTISDSLRWETIVPQEGGLGGIALLSPDGSRIAIQVSGADVERNAAVDTVLVFDTQEVRRFVQGGNLNAPEPIRIRTFARRPSGRLRNLTWTRSGELAFIAESNEGVAQLFVANNRGVLRQLSNSLGDVISFAITPGHILYYAHPLASERPAIIAVSQETLPAILFPEHQSADALIYVRRIDETGVDTPTSVRSRLRPFMLRIWPSPLGDQAIVLLPVDGHARSWARYQVADEARFGFGRQESNRVADASMFRAQYGILNVRTGRVRVLIEAPLGTLAGNGTPLFVRWVDNRRVIVSNSYLPLDGSPDREFRPATAEVDVAANSVRPVFWEPALSRDARDRGERLRERVTRFGWDDARRQLIVDWSRQSSDGNWRPTTTRYFCPASGECQSVDDEAARPVPSTAELEISVRESLNSLPLIEARIGNSSSVLYDPNPNVRAEVRLSRAEALAWRDEATGLSWRAGLLYPEHYVDGRRYPLIVQSHGFDPDTFLIDGPRSPLGGSTAMAARAFASAGFIVLQLEDNPGALTRDNNEGRRVASGIAAGIGDLVRRGLVDRDHVGYIGFSRTGFHALYLLSDFPGLIRAMTIADAVQANYLQSFVLGTNGPTDFRFSLNRMAGVQDGSLRQLSAAHPLYALQNQGTAFGAAVRIEANGPEGLLSMWETYATFRNFSAPVDLVYFREGSHVQFRPAERLASQGGNLDWFRFWLQNYEDPDPAKVEQYQRWRELRRHRCERLGSGSGSLCN